MQTSVRWLTFTTVPCTLWQAHLIPPLSPLQNPVGLTWRAGGIGKGALKIRVNVTEVQPQSPPLLTLRVFSSPPGPPPPTEFLYSWSYSVKQSLLQNKEPSVRHLG